MNINKDNRPLLLAGLMVAAYIYLNRGQAQMRAQQAQQGYRVGTMPGSAGSGLNQVQAGALAGFLGSVVGSVFKNNGATSYVQPEFMAGGSDVVQDRVQDAGFLPSVEDTGMWA